MLDLNNIIINVAYLVIVFCVFAMIGVTFVQSIVAILTYRKNSTKVDLSLIIKTVIFGVLMFILANGLYLIIAKYGVSKSLTTFKVRIQDLLEHLVFEIYIFLPYVCAIFSLINAYRIVRAMVKGTNVKKSWIIKIIIFSAISLIMLAFKEGIEAGLMDKAISDKNIHLYRIMKLIDSIK